MNVINPCTCLRFSFGILISLYSPLSATFLSSQVFPNHTHVVKRWLLIYLQVAASCWLNFSFVGHLPHFLWSVWFNTFALYLTVMYILIHMHQIPSSKLLNFFTWWKSIMSKKIGPTFEVEIAQPVHVLFLVLSRPTTL